MLKNTENHFGLVTRANHWLSAFIFISAIIVGIYAEEFMDKGDARNQMFQLHFSLGLSIFALMLLRILWLKLSPNPAPIGENRLETVLSHIVKGFLYLAMILLPILGYLMVSSGGHEISFFQMFTLPNLIGENKSLHDITHELHVIGGFSIIAILALHIAAALKHHFILKDDTLLRMLGKSSKSSD